MGMIAATRYTASSQSAYLETAVRETAREFPFPLHYAWSFAVPLVMPVQSDSPIYFLVLDLAGAWVYAVEFSPVQSRLVKQICPV